MKHIWKIFPLIAGIIFLLSSCDKTKVDDLAFSNNGTVTALSASSATIAPAPVDSDKVVVTYTWADANYATDSAHKKYIVEIDTAGGNFENAARKTVIGDLKAEFTAKELNSILLGYGFPFNVAKNMIVRVTSSYLNNNEQFHSNVLTSVMSAYKIPPKIALPASGHLYFVGDATPFGWDVPNPVQLEREFAQIDETTFGGVVNLSGSGGYKVFEKINNWWETSYHPAADPANPLTGSFTQGDPGPTFPSPSAAGWYKVILDFQKGIYTVTATDAPFTGTAPDNLCLVGGATPGGWANPVSEATQKFTKLSNGVFELTISLTAGEKYLMLPVNGSWDAKFGGSDDMFGPIVGQGSDIPAPPVSGTYKITVNFNNHTRTLVKV